MGSFIKQRRDFIKTLGCGAAAWSIPFSGNSAVADVGQQRFAQTESFLNGFDLELLFSDGFFQGIGAVKQGGIQLRSRRLPMFVHISTPDAVELVNYKLIEKVTGADELIFRFNVQQQLANTMEWMLHTVRNRRNMGDWTETPSDAAGTEVKMILKPVQRKIGAQSVMGFSYQYVFSSNHLSVYKITDRSSWEIGGAAIGNEFWMRNGVIDAVKLFHDQSEFYSTEWYLPGNANPNIFQFHPLQTHLQGFTFTCSEAGTLVTFPSRVSHIRSLFEKWRGADEIVHFHEHCNDLSQNLETSPVEVLWLPGRLDSAGRANLYNLIREMVHVELHDQIGMKRERISTYGVIEEWTEPDFDNYSNKILPQLIEAGAKTIFIPNQCQNDMNVWGLSNMCCNVDFKIAESVNEERLKQFCQIARSKGAKVEMWGNTAISTLTERMMHQEGKPKGINFLPERGSIMEVIRKSASPFVRNASNAIEADHYTPRFCALNLRDKDIRAYWMKQWKYFHDEIGIDGIFLDSSFNMSSDKFHHAQFDSHGNWSGATLDQKEKLGKFRPKSEPPQLIQTQYHAHLSWVVEMQKMGYQYCAEDMGVFGINRTGPDVLERLKNLHIWADSYCDFDERKIAAAGFDPFEIFFKGIAYRMMWKLYWNFRKKKPDLGTDHPQAFQLLKIYNQVNDFLQNRQILANESGVVYRKEKASVLWSFRNQEYQAEGAIRVVNLQNGSNVKVKENGCINADKLTVYLIELS